MKKIFILILFLLSGISIFAQDAAILYPATDTKIYPSETIEILWSNPKSRPIDLYYRLDMQAWILIGNDLLQNSYIWTVPQTNAQKISFKVTYSVIDTPVLYWHQENASLNEIRSGLFSPSGKRILTGSADNIVRLWDFDQKSLLYEVNLDTIGNLLYSIPYSDDIAYVSLDEYLVQLDFSSSDVISNVISIGSAVRSLDCTEKKGGMVAASSLDGYVYIFDTNLNFIKKFQSTSSENLYSVRFSRDGKLICLSDYEGVIDCYDIETGELVFSVSGHGANQQNTVVWSVDISPDNTTVLSGGVDASVRLWSVFNENELKKFDRHSGHVRSVRFSPDGLSFISGSLDGMLRHYDALGQYENENIAINHGNGILSVDYSPNSDYIISSGRGNDFKVWRIFESVQSQDVVESQIIRKIGFHIPHLFVNLNENFNLPVISDYNKSETLFSKNKFNLTLKIEIPVLIVDVEQLGEPRTGITYDTLQLETEFDITMDTVVNLNAFSLLGPTNYGDLKLLEVSSDSELDIETDDGSVTISDGCEGFAGRGVQVSGNQPGLKVSPNPASDILYLSVDVVEDSEYTIKITDYLGKTSLISEKSYLRSGFHEITLNTSELHDGVYFLTFSNKKVIFTRKIIIKNI